MKRDLYAEVSARIVAELEAGAAPWIKPWSATPGANTPCNAVTNRPYPGCNVVLLWMAQAAGYRTPRFLTFKQALELGGNVRKGQRGTKVYFVKQLQVRDQDADESSSTRLIPMMREYKHKQQNQISEAQTAKIRSAKHKQQNQIRKRRRAATPRGGIGPKLTTMRCVPLSSSH